MMPKGVEHNGKCYENKPRYGVKIPMMPKGVEHSMLLMNAASEP